jgi:hypothetical protein
MPKWRRDSIFGTGPRQPLNREQRARVRFLARQHRMANRITANDLCVVDCLISALGTDGRLDLSYATIAARVGCHVATVGRALGRLRALGLVSWVRRLVRSSFLSWRCQQASNAYCLLPEAPSFLNLTKPTSGAACASQRLTTLLRPTASIADGSVVAAARAALAAIAASRQARLH